MTVIITKLIRVALLVLIVCFTSISDVRAQTGRSVKLNESAVAFASQLMQQGHFIADRKGAWREHKPSFDAENEFIRAHGIAEYAKWHLGLDERYGVNAKRRYKFPYGDFINVHRCGLLAVKARAAEHEYHDIEDAAARLIGTTVQGNSGKDGRKGL